MTIISSQFINSRRFNNPLLNDEWVKKEIQKEKEILELNENEYTTKLLGHIKSSFKREVYNPKCLHLKYQKRAQIKHDASQEF